MNFGQQCSILFNFIILEGLSGKVGVLFLYMMKFSTGSLVAEIESLILGAFGQNNLRSSQLYITNIECQREKLCVFERELAANNGHATEFCMLLICGRVGTGSESH